MPGLKQLQQFNSDILNLGNEVKIRAARGEKPATIKIPKTVKDIDDSEEFVAGLPEISEEEKAQNAAAQLEKENQSKDFDEFVSESVAKDSGKNAETPEKKDEPVISDVSELLPSSENMSLNELDLSEFESGSPEEKNAEEEKEPEPVSIEDMDLSSLLAPSSESGAMEAELAESSLDSEPVPEISEENPLESDAETPEANEDLPEMPSSDDAAAENDVAEENAEKNIPDINSEFGDSESPVDLTSDVPVEFNEIPDLNLGVQPAEEKNAEEETSSPDESNVSSEEPGDNGGLDLGDLPEFGDDGSAEIDLPEFGDANENDSESPSLTDSVSPEDSIPDDEKVDVSEISDLDFSQDDGSNDFELGTISASEGDDDFYIPGFSDTDSANLNKQDLSSPNYSDAKEADDGKPKNTFTDAEYKRFLKNLSMYPLNVRVALEDFIVKNEFTDDAIFAVLEKVLRKAPARQVATELEKLLDITIDVPRDFERRSASEYEAYKKSIEYQLKNVIIPGAILTTVAAVLIGCIFLLTNKFIYKPLRASSLYKQGYALLQDCQYPQSEETFNYALTYKPVKKWFFSYAEGYRDHKQFDRARMMYKAILQRYKHDKKAGLDYAAMELEDLANYEEGEKILKREVLDYYINDTDGILALGDLYLEWASDKDPSKFENAKEQYDLLTELDADDNICLSRQLRYFMRTDNLREVLIYKEVFMNRKKGTDAQDAIELSGYIFDKRYGKLRPSEENLRSSIEDVRKLLELALKHAPENPIALYNMARYFVETGNDKGAIKLLDASIKNFELQKRRSRRDMYKYINAHRLLGEQYRDQKLFGDAERVYGDGIELFESENAASGFQSDENVGHLYADLGDIDYYEAADNDAALRNYEHAVNNKYDTSSVRYKIGYIQYEKENYPEALGSFIRSQDTSGNDMHLLLALANTLSLSSDNYVAKGYYERLLSLLGAERQKYSIILPQVRSDHADIVDLYLRASNNLGVTLARIAKLTGDSSMNAKAIVNLQDSLRAWDALARNQETMIRPSGSNLAEMNIKYIIQPMPSYEPEVYTEIPRTLCGEEWVK